MLNLELDQVSERRLAEQAMRFGLTTERYAALLLREAMTVRSSPAGPLIDPTVEEWERELDGLIEHQDDSISPIPEDAMRRESLYEGRS